MLQETASGRIIWGRGHDLLFPRDNGYGLARPLRTDRTGDSGVKAVGVIEEMRIFGLIRRQIYRPIVELMTGVGYHRGDLERPRADDSFFLYAYDWRDDLVTSARKLADLLDGVRAARQVARLEVDLICQSAGGQICRYLAKYGGMTLEQAEAGSAPPSSVAVSKLILVATANGGSSRIVRELHRGRTYIPGVGRKIRPEVLSSFASLYQDLPIYRDDVFLDESGEPLALDVFDPAVWRDHGLAIFAPETRARIARNGATQVFEDEDARFRAVGRFLDRGRRLHEVLSRDVDGFAAAYYSIQNMVDETPDQIVLRRRGGGWTPLFSGDSALRRMGALHDRVTTGGDGHASLASQAWLSPQESAAMAAEPFYLEGDHFKMILEPEAKEKLLEYLSQGSGDRSRGRALPELR